MPKFDPIQCTEAMMAATNREAELEAMQFADADSEAEADEETNESVDDYDDEEMTGKESHSVSEPMEATLGHTEISRLESSGSTLGEVVELLSVVFMKGWVSVRHLG